MTAQPARDPWVEVIVNKAQADGIGGRYGNVHPLGDSRPGKFSLVFDAVDARTGENVILKFLHPAHNQDYRGQCFQREARVGELFVGRDNIVQMRSALDTYVIKLQDGVTKLEVDFPFRFFALERARGTLSQLMFNPRRPRTLARRLRAVRDVVKGVNRLHAAGYCHRDLKPDNCLMFYGGVAKVSDFGTCRPLDGQDPLQPDYPYPVGDLMYAPPEMFCGGGNRNSLYAGADWFSVGAILFEIVTSQNLYVAIGLRNAQDVLQALRVASDVDNFAKQVSTIAGNYPIPATTDFSHQPWLARTSAETHNAVTSLIRGLCHFDWERRQKKFERILAALDICISRAQRDLGN